MQFSNSRIATFRSCNKKFFYNYVEEIPQPESPALLLGTLFHKVLEYHYDETKDVNTVFEEYKGYVMVGRLETNPIMFEHLYHEYLKHYAVEMKQEVLLMNETKIEIALDEDEEDIVVGIIDKVVQVEGQVIQRDHKTTSGKLKYDVDMVRYSQQQLLYKQMIELTTKFHVDAVEIDEIKMAVLEDVPLNKNGKPTTDYRRLGLVTHEAYHAVLVELGLDGDPDYDSIMSRLMDRGHPLFRRTTVQIMNENIVHENILDFEATVKAIKREEHYPRTRSILCNYCGYKQLCKLDYTNPDEMDRQMLIKSESNLD